MKPISLRIRLAGGSALLGGLCWMVKAASILLTGIQPPLLFEAAPIFFAITLVGLASHLGVQGGRRARWGRVLAILSGLAAAIQVAAESLTPELLPHSGEVTLLTPVIVLAGLGSLAALLLVGLAVRQARPLPSPWSDWPLAMALAFLLLMGLAGLATAFLEMPPVVAERLIEAPVLVVGLAWFMLGWRLLLPSP